MFDKNSFPFDNGIRRFSRMKVPHLKATREYQERQISRRLFMVAKETYASTNPFRESGNRDNCHRIFVTIQGRTRVVKDNTRVLNFTTRRRSIKRIFIEEWWKMGRRAIWAIIFKSDDTDFERIDVNQDSRFSIPFLTICVYFALFGEFKSTRDSRRNNLN